MLNAQRSQAALIQLKTCLVCLRASSRCFLNFDNLDALTVSPCRNLTDSCLKYSVMPFIQVDTRKSSGCERPLWKKVHYLFGGFFSGNIHILFYSFDKILHRIIELGQTGVPAHNMTLLAGDGSCLASLPPQSSTSGIIYYSKLFLFTSEGISQKLFNVEGSKEMLECLFWLCLGALSQPAAPEQGCPHWGSERALAASHPRALSGRFVSVALPKKGFPNPFPSPWLEGGPRAVTLQTHPPGGSQGLLLLLWVKGGLQTDTERGRNDTYGDSDTSVL